MLETSDTMMLGPDAGLLHELRQLKSAAEHTPDQLRRLAFLASSAFDRGFLDYAQDRDLAGVLCALAIGENGAVRELGQNVLFSHVVERLSDSFSAEAVDRYDRVFAHVIDIARRLPEARLVDELLNRFDVRSEQDLLKRRLKVRSPLVLHPVRRRAIKKAFVLSRVTLGADVAITSLVVQAVRSALPQAQIVLLAPRPSLELFGGDTDLKIIDVPYARRGGLLERLGSWVGLVRAQDRERGTLGPGECIVIDPDSRLTQLGLLPVVDDDSDYRFFESRSFQRPGRESLGGLTVEWLREVFGAPNEAYYPRVSLRARDLDLGVVLSRALRTGEGSHIVSTNFGVGGNPRKRVTGAFEIELLRQLLAQGSVIVLDKGVGEEREGANRILASLRADGRAVVEVKDGDRFAERNGPVPRCDVLAWEGGVGTFSALIAASDLYIGYDSAFQHIAAALEVPVVDIFVEPGPVFMRRWQPYSRAPVRVVSVDRVTADAGDRSEEAVAPVLDVYREMRRLPPRYGKWAERTHPAHRSAG